MTTRIKFLTLSILFSLTAFISFGQKSNLLTSTVKEIARYNIYETTNTVGYANVVSKQYQRFELLISLATEEQLIKLATHNKSAIVRLYALQALRRKNITIPDIMKQQFQKDNTIVDILEGCLGDKKSVNMLAMQELKVPVSFSN
jgi:hypothetical protein